MGLFSVVNSTSALTALVMGIKPNAKMLGTIVFFGAVQTYLERLVTKSRDVSPQAHEYAKEGGTLDHRFQNSTLFLVGTHIPNSHSGQVARVDRGGRTEEHSEVEVIQLDTMVMAILNTIRTRPRNNFHLA